MVSKTYQITVNEPTRIYKDLDLDFGRNTVTNDVNKLTDVENS